MEQEIKQARKIKMIPLMLLGLLLAVYTWKYDAFNHFLLNSQPLGLMHPGLWSIFVKIISYGIHLAMGYFILWVLTQQHKYSIYLMVVSLSFLLMGSVLVLFCQRENYPWVSLIISFIVKLVKSQVLLVFFIAAYIVRTEINMNDR